MTTKTNVINLKVIQEKLDRHKRLFKEIHDELKANELYGNDDDLTIADKVPSIQEYTDKIIELTDEKSRLIRLVLGNMIKGSLGNLTFRKKDGEGNIFYYKRHRPVQQLRYVKAEIMKNLHEAKEKLSDINLDILEAIINLIDDNKNEEDKKEVNIKLSNEEILISTDYREAIEFDKVNYAIIKTDGSVKFQEDLSENYHSGNRNIFSNLLFKKYQKQIEIASQQFEAKLQKDIELLEQDIKTIKEKGSNILMIHQMKKDVENVGDLYAR